MDRKSIKRRIAITISLCTLTLAINVKSEELVWPQFRGPKGQGVSVESKQLPTNLDVSKNLLWKTSLPKGHSSPCIWKNHIFLTGYADKKLQTLCLNRNDGSIAWRRIVPADNIERVHGISSPAAPTPTTDGERVYVYFGSYGLLCYNYQGKELWKRPLPIPAINYGSGTSPILANDLLVLNRDQNKDSFLLAVDKKTGRTVWKKDRPGFTGSWSTPLHRKYEGNNEVVIFGSWRVVGYSLQDGTECWTVGGLALEPCSTPVTAEGLVFITSYNPVTSPDERDQPDFGHLLETHDSNKDGQLTRDEIPSNLVILQRIDSDGEGDIPVGLVFQRVDMNEDGVLTAQEWAKGKAFFSRFKTVLVAIRPGGELDASETTVVWKHGHDVPEVPSPLYYKGRVYIVKNGGVVSCFDAKTGHRFYRERLGAGGPYYSSPVAGDGKIYVASARGVVSVFQAGDSLKVLSKNDLGERVMGTTALVDGKVYIRTEKCLYVFGE